MESEKIFDVVIVGGGPAGLSVGAELAKKGHKVAVIEKGTAGTTYRSWIVPGYIIAKLDPEVQKYAYNGVNRFLEYTPDFEVEWDTVGPWDVAQKYKTYPFINQEGILGYWVDVIKKNGSEVFDNQIYIDLKYENDHVVVKSVSTSDGSDFSEYKGRLILDASGYDSDLAKKERVNRDGYFWWSVYGFDIEFDDVTKLKHPGDLGNMKVGDFMLWNSFKNVPMQNDASLSQLRPIMEYEVLDEKHVFVLILYFFNDLVTKDYMKNSLNYLVQTEDTIASLKTGKIVKDRFGWYPSAAISQQISKDRMAFIGDAGCWTIPAGWGMSFILDNYAEYAERISKALNENKLDKNTLNDAAKLNVRQKYEVLMDKVVLHFLSYAEPNIINKFTKIIKDKFGGGMLETMFCLQMTEEQAVETMIEIWKNFTWQDLRSVHLPKEDIWMIGEAAMYFGESFINTMTRKLFGLKPERTGFEFK